MTAFPNAEHARRYLLGETTEDENATIEARYLEDQAAFDHLASVEDDLIEAYLDHRLTASEHQHFEQAYLSSPRRRARVETIRRLRAAAPTPATAAPPASSAPTTVVSIETARRERRAWRPWMALAASLLMAGGIGWQWSHRAAGDAAVAVNQAGPSRETTRPQPPLPERSGPATTTPSPSLFTIALSASLVRGASDVPPVTVPAGVDRIELRLELEPAGRPLAATRASIRTVTGDERWQADVVVADQAARLEVPANLLAADDYLVTLFGAEREGGPEVEWAQYVLRVR